MNRIDTNSNKMANEELLIILNERIRMFDNQRKTADRIKELQKKAKSFIKEQEMKEIELINLLIKTENKNKNK